MDLGHLLGVQLERMGGQSDMQEWILMEKYLGGINLEVVTTQMIFKALRPDKSTRPLGVGEERTSTQAFDR